MLPDTLLRDFADMLCAESRAVPFDWEKQGFPSDVVVGVDSWQCTMVDSDGERDTFTRRIKTGWEVETLIAAQLRAGFVDV